MTRSNRTRQILVGVDLSGLALQALVRAFALADRLDADLEVLHAVESVRPRGAVADEDRHARHDAEILERARVQVERMVAEARAASGVSERDATATVAAAGGRPADVLLRRAAEGDADLLLVGPHAERPVFDFGSTTRALLGHAPIPVWSQVGPAHALERVLIPVDFSEHSREAVHRGLQLASELGLPTALMHCYVPPSYAYSPELVEQTGSNYVVDADREQERTELARWIADLDERGLGRAQALFVEGDPRVAIADESGPADLVVMGTQGRSGFSRFFLGSVAYSVVRESVGAVVVVPPAEESE